MEDPQRSGPWLAQLRRAAAFLQGHTRASAGIVALALLGAALNAVEPLVFMYIFDGLVAEGAARVLLVGMVALATLAVAHELIGGFSSWLYWRVRQGLQYQLLEAIVTRLQSLPLSYHREHGVGGTMTRLDRGINGFVHAVSELVCGILPSVAYLAIALA